MEPDGRTSVRLPGLSLVGTGESGRGLEERVPQAGRGGLASRL